MKLNIRKPTIRRRKVKSAQDTGTSYKCLMLGPNLQAKAEFLAELDGEGGEANEVTLRTDKKEFVFWRSEVKVEHSMQSLKQFLDFHDPHVIFYFMEGEEKANHLHLFNVLDIVRERPSKICLVLDMESVDRWSQDEEINDDNERNVHHCFIDFKSIKASAELLTATENVPLDDMLPLWEEEDGYAAFKDDKEEANINAERVEEDGDAVDEEILENP